MGSLDHGTVTPAQRSRSLETSAPLEIGACCITLDFGKCWSKRLGDQPTKSSAFDGGGALVGAHPSSATSALIVAQSEDELQSSVAVALASEREREHVPEQGGIPDVDGELKIGLRDPGFRPSPPSLASTGTCPDEEREREREKDRTPWKASSPANSDSPGHDFDERSGAPQVDTTSTDSTVQDALAPPRQCKIKVSLAPGGEIVQEEEAASPARSSDSGARGSVRRFRQSAAVLVTRAANFAQGHRSILRRNHDDSSHQLGDTVEIQLTSVKKYGFGLETLLSDDKLTLMRVPVYSPLWKWNIEHMTAQGNSNHVIDTCSCSYQVLQVGNLQSPEAMQMLLGTAKNNDPPLTVKILFRRQALLKPRSSKSLLEDDVFAPEGEEPKKKWFQRIGLPSVLKRRSQSVGGNSWGGRTR